MSSEPHRALLVKVLNEAHVAQDISVEGFGGLVNNITANNYLAFAEEEIPAEGIGHNKALHVSVKCMDHIVAKVLIDNGSSLNVMPIPIVHAFSKPTLAEPVHGVGHHRRVNQRGPLEFADRHVAAVLIQQRQHLKPRHREIKVAQHRERRSRHVFVHLTDRAGSEHPGQLVGSLEVRRNTRETVEIMTFSLRHWPVLSANAQRLSREADCWSGVNPPHTTPTNHVS